MTAERGTKLAHPTPATQQGDVAPPGTHTAVGTLFHVRERQKEGIALASAASTKGGKRPSHRNGRPSWSSGPAAVLTWGPAYFETVLHFSSQQAGALIALPCAWGTIAMVGLSALARRLHLRGIPTRRSRAWVLGGAALTVRRLASGRCHSVLTHRVHGAHGRRLRYRPGSVRPHDAHRG